MLYSYCRVWFESAWSPLTAFDPWRTSKAGAASRPIAGKPGSHKYCTGPETGYISVGAGLPAMRPVLTTGRWHGVRHGAFAVIYDPKRSLHALG